MRHICYYTTLTWSITCYTVTSRYHQILLSSSFVSLIILQQETRPVRSSCKTLFKKKHNRITFASERQRPFLLSSICKLFLIKYANYLRLVGRITRRLNEDLPALRASSSRVRVVCQSRTSSTNVLFPVTSSSFNLSLNFNSLKVQGPKRVQ